MTAVNFLAQDLDLLLAMAVPEIQLLFYKNLGVEGGRLDQGRKHPKRATTSES